MSYCRFSDDNWKSDAYIYESAEGYVCHVATNRIVGNIPEEPEIYDKDYRAAHTAQMDYLSSAERVAIGGEYDGETRVFSILQELSDFIGELILAGYHVPVWAIDEIQAEMNSQ